MKRKTTTSTALAVIDIPKPTDLLPATVPPIKKAQLIEAMIAVAQREREEQIKQATSEQVVAEVLLEEYFQKPSTVKALVPHLQAALAALVTGGIDRYSARRMNRDDSALPITLDNVGNVFPQNIKDAINVIANGVPNLHTDYEIKELRRKLRNKMTPDIGGQVHEAINNPVVYAALKESLRAIGE